MPLTPRQSRRLDAERAVQPPLPLRQALLPALGDAHLLITVDTLNEGVHFRAADDPMALGHKSLAVNLSDLAAMGAQPRWVTLALRLPDGQPSTWFDQFMEGFETLARTHGVVVTAVDVASGPLSITVEALGAAPAGASLRRAGARAGDRVFVSGTLGDAACALQQRLSGHDRDAVPALRQRLDRPQPRLALGQLLRGRASSAIDISDGLAADLGHILDASGVGATLWAARLPLSETLRACASGDQALAWALAGGDDYELCFTVPPARCQALRDALHGCEVAVTEIGVVDAQPGLRVLDAEGREVHPGRGGYDHFSL